MFKNKLKAFAIHLTLSIVIVSLIMLTIVYYWFPFSFLRLTDFKEIALLIVSIDLVLGPVLTFIIFNPNKKSLAFDLSTVGLIQIAALSYGVHTLYQVHPLYITFAQSTFTLVSAKDVEIQKAKYKEYKISKLHSAKLAFAKMPEDTNTQAELTFNALSGGADLEERVDYYEPYDNHINDIIAKSLDPNTIFSDQNNAKKVDTFLKKYGNSLNKFAYLPLVGTKNDAIIVINKKTAQPVTNLHISPWKYVKK